MINKYNIIDTSSIHGFDSWVGTSNEKSFEVGSDFHCRFFVESESVEVEKNQVLDMRIAYDANNYPS